MVTFNNAGRMGNWLFECATAISYSLKHNLDFTVLEEPHKDKYHNPVYCRHLINTNYDKSIGEIRLWENCHQYQELPFDESWRGKNIIIEGYRQTEKYFKEYRNEILYLFGFPWEQKDFISIHIRRGDYLKLPEKHPPFSIEYMRCATSRFYMMGYKYFKVFSDDIEWCKEHFKDDHYSAMKIEFSTNTNEVDDLTEMSCGIWQISSSSTFGWWGAWLNRNPDKVIITPKQWFQPGWMGMNTDDIIPETWIKI